MGVEAQTTVGVHPIFARKKNCCIRILPQKTIALFTVMEQKLPTLNLKCQQQDS